MKFDISIITKGYFIEHMGKIIPYLENGKFYEYWLDNNEESIDCVYVPADKAIIQNERDSFSSAGMILIALFKAPEEYQVGDKFRIRSFYDELGKYVDKDWTYMGNDTAILVSDKRYAISKTAFKNLKVILKNKIW